MKGGQYYVRKRLPKEACNQAQRNVVPGCLVVKNDAQLKQGIPDLLILHNNKWAALEVKNSEKAHHQPNQDIYVDRLNGMSYATFIYPENEEQVFKELRRVLK